MADSTGYSVDEIVGLTLYAKRGVTMYRLPDSSSEVVRTINSGDRVGTVYSYVNRSGNIWWQVGNGLTTDGYVLHQTGIFDIGALRDQGALTTEELLEAKALQEALDNKPFTLLGGLDDVLGLKDFFLSDTGKTVIKIAKYAAIIIIGFAVIKYVLPIASDIYKTSHAKKLKK